MTTIPVPMFSHRLTDDIVLLLRTAAIADAYHELIVVNQKRLARWEPWAVQPPSPESTRAFLEAAGRSWLEGSELPVAIAVLADGSWRLVGSVGLRINRYTRVGDVGYWIDAAYEGRGLVTKAVSAVLDEAFGPLGLDKVTLHTEVDNDRSRELARRLGFVEEGVLRHAIAFPEARRDQVAYGLLGLNGGIGPPGADDPNRLVLGPSLRLRVRFRLPPPAPNSRSAVTPGPRRPDVAMACHRHVLISQRRPVALLRAHQPSKKRCQPGRDPAGEEAPVGNTPAPDKPARAPGPVALTLSASVAVSKPRPQKPSDQLKTMPLSV